MNVALAHQELEAVQSQCRREGSTFTGWAQLRTNG